jgi:nitrogen fixation NifU-like protein
MRDPESGMDVDPNQIGEGMLTEDQLIYKENILDHYKHPHNKKHLEHATVRHHAVNPSCGDTIDIALLIENEKIVDVGFTGSGCAISQASMSMLSEKILGMTLEEVEHLQQDDVLGLLGIPIGIVRMKCAMLGLRTTQEALK